MKLQFEENEYYLMKDGEELAIATTDESFIKELGAEMLSRKNCQAIANGYDLDELVREACDITDPLRLDSQKYKQDPYFKIGFIKGFQKALSILGDKKFSEFLDREKELGISDIKTIERIQWYYKTYFDKSQQTEWDVYVEMEAYYYEDFLNDGETHILEEKFRPRLDVDGCLILKRK